MFHRNTFKIHCCLSVFFVMALVSGPSIRAQQAAASSPLDRMNWLIGQWSAGDQPVDGKPVFSQIVAKWSSDHSAIQVTCVRVPAGQDPMPAYTATYVWDAASKRITVKQAYANGDRFEGIVIPSGTDFDQTGQMVRANGSKQNVEMKFDAWAQSTFNLTVQAEGQSPSPAPLPLVYLRQDPFTNAAAGAAEVTPPAKQ
jgi:hypothetical protein